MSTGGWTSSQAQVYCDVVSKLSFSNSSALLSAFKSSRLTWGQNSKWGKSRPQGPSQHPEESSSYNDHQCNLAAESESAAAFCLLSQRPPSASRPASPHCWSAKVVKTFRRWSHSKILSHLHIITITNNGGTSQGNYTLNIAKGVTDPSYLLLGLMQHL